jgi:flagellar biosynthesis protein FlhB
MKFLSGLYAPILKKNLLLYNLLITLTVILIYIVVLFAFWGIMILIAIHYAELSGISAAHVLESILIAVILPIFWGVIDFVFCLFLLLRNLKFSRPEIPEISLEKNDII